jgi:hypothetical protein
MVVSLNRNVGSVDSWNWDVAGTDRCQCEELPLIRAKFQFGSCLTYSTGSLSVAGLFSDVK